MRLNEDRCYEDRIASDWIATYSPAEPPPDAYDPIIVMETIIDSDPSMGWFILSAVLDQDANGASLPTLIAGPFGSWVHKYAEKWINFIEGEAATNPRFKWALGGLNQYLITDEVWGRIERARGTIWSGDSPPPVPPPQGEFE